MCRRVRMAIDACKLRVVGRNLMAVCAHRIVMRDREPGVIKGCSCPRRRRMAGVAGCGIAGRDVVRDRAAQGLRTVPIRLVASIAGRVRRGE